MTWEALEQVFNHYDYPYSRQGSYAEADRLPVSFFTFWNFDTPEESFYDNAPNRVVWRWQIYFYTKDPSLMYSVMDDLIAYAKTLGFVPDGRAWDIDSNEPEYVGRTVRLLYVETI